MPLFDQSPLNIPPRPRSRVDPAYLAQILAAPEIARQQSKQALFEQLGQLPQNLFNTAAAVQQYRQQQAMNQPVRNVAPALAQSFPELADVPLLHIKDILPSLAAVRKGQPSALDIANKESLINTRKERLGLAKERMTQLSPQASQTLSNADSALTSLDNIGNMIKADPSVLVKAALPGKLGAREFDFERNNASDMLLRARSGAQINESEFRRLFRLFPTLADYVEYKRTGSFDHIDRKLNTFRTSYGSLIKNLQQGRVGLDEGRDAPSKMPQGSNAAPAQSPIAFSSPGAVKSAVKGGKLSADQAKTILRNQFGFGD